MKTKTFKRLFLMLVMLVTAATGIHATKYVTDVVVIGCEESSEVDNLWKTWRNAGYTVDETDLNKGCKGSWFVYLAYKLQDNNSYPETDFVTDLMIFWHDPKTREWNNKTYKRCDNNKDFNGNLNRGCGAIAQDLYLYQTKERNNLTNHGFSSQKRCIKSLEVVDYEKKPKLTDDGYVCMDNSTDPQDCNQMAGGRYIYIKINFENQKREFKEKPQMASGLVYDGTTQDLLATNPWKNNRGTLLYRIDGGTWSSSAHTAKNVGTYKVEYYLAGNDYIYDSDVYSGEVTIDAPTIAAKNLYGTFDQAEKTVTLNWSVGAIPGNYANYKWVIYRDNVKIATVNADVLTYVDKKFLDDTSHNYDVYYVSNTWNEDTKKDGAKKSVTVNTMRHVPINNLVVEQRDDRIAFSWSSDGYKAGFGNEFKIYVDNETDPIITITPTDMQTNFSWEHRTTNQHKNRKNGTDGNTYYTEEPLNVCDPHTYHIDGVISDKVLNTQTVNYRSIGQGTLFYDLDASKGVYEGTVKLSWHVNLQGSEMLKTYIIERRRAEQENDAWETLTRLSSTDEYLFYTDDTALPGIFYDYRVTVEDKCDDGTIHHNGISDTGFAKSSGTVTGRIAYGSSGTAVQGAEVKLVMNSTTGDEAEQYHSMYFNDQAGAVTWTYPSETYAEEKLAGSDFTTQLWMYPEEFSDSPIIDFGNSITLSMTSEGKLGFTENLITIGSAADWESFAQKVNNGNTNLSAIMVADVQLSSTATLVGDNIHMYSGIFDGNGHTLTVDINLYNYYASPFRYVNSATIRNLRVAGSIVSTLTDAGGLIGYSEGTTSISNCIVNATINCTKDYTWHGGFVAANYDTLNITNSLFNGVIISSKEQIWGGFVGASYKRCIFNSCLFAPKDLELAPNTTLYPFAQTTSNLQDLPESYAIYYTQALGKAQGTDAANMNQDELLAKLGSGWTVNNGNLEPKQVSNVSEMVDQHFEGITLRKKNFNHVVLSHKADSLTVIVLTPDSINNPVIQKASLKLERSLDLKDATRFEIGHFKGAVDEFRLWTKALTEDDILENYDHLLVGNEPDLETYWTFDEGLRTQFFDYSRNGTNFHKHHGKVGNNAATSNVTPDVLALKAKTDKDGNYELQGIPYSGEGISYSVVPSYGIHQFNPSKTLKFFSNSSLVHTADFEDISSFVMSGHIYYAGTNIPVDSVMIYVDAVPQSVDGQLVMTDDKGYYEVSVPIGKHYVEAKKGGHTFAGNGRYPTQGMYDFSNRVSYDFSDSTLVNFTGRVTGGERNDTLAVGFGLSKNNIGIATLQLKLNNDSFSFNCEKDHITTAASNRSWESDTIAINSTAWTGTGSFDKYIYIRTDSITGEFSAKLPPLKYTIEQLAIDNNRHIEFSQLPEINLTNAQQINIDSLRAGERDSAIVGPIAYQYHTKEVFTYYADPQVDVYEKANGTMGAFGVQELEDCPVGNMNNPESVTISDIWKQEEDGTISYLFDFPLYQKGRNVRYDIFGYEKYINYDGGENSLKVDILPLNGQELTLINEMSDEQKVVYKVPEDGSDLKPGDLYEITEGKITLDTNGEASYQWSVGLPNTQSPFTRNFSITMERNDRTYAPFAMNAIVLGDLPEGNNFVTQGPDIVQFVLRDPYGAKSKTTLKRAQITARTKMDSHKAKGNHQLVVQTIGGAKITLAEGGVGIMLITAQQITADLNLGTHWTWTNGWSDETCSTTTYTQAISTSSDPRYVGSAGDVFVGLSTNLLLGKTRNVCIGRDHDTNKFKIMLEDALSLGEQVKTNFMYSAYELENVMIPKWKDQRLSYLTEVGSKKEAENYPRGDKAAYVTWEKKDRDIDYVEGTNYIMVPPKQVTVTETDSVQWCTNQINSWKQELYNNEQNKIEAMKRRLEATKEPWNGWQNFSIDGGSSYTYSVRKDSTHTHKKEKIWYAGGIIGTDFGFSLSATKNIGHIVHITSEQGREQSVVKTDKDEDYQEWEYTLNDGNVDADLSIDKYPSGVSGYSDVFSLFGGQTYNPYEGKEYTKWYDPGLRVLSNGSEQMEQPDIRVSTDGLAEHSGKAATLLDVPSGQRANYTLFISNKSSANRKSDPSFVLSLPDDFNSKGLIVKIDGQAVTSSHTIWVPKGEMVKKIITVEQSDQSILKYDSVKVKLASPYQSSIYDYVLLHTHFKPSSSQIDLVIDKPVFNIENMQRTKGKLEMKLTNFNRQFTGMKKVGVEYRYEGNTSWTAPAELQFYLNEKDVKKPGDQLLPDDGDILLEYDISDSNYYPQGNYTFRAYTMTEYGTEPIYVYSDEMTVVKDDQAPRQLTTPTPTNGILGYGDDMMVEFNEDIVPGYVTDKNVIVTAKLNSQQVVHDVAKQLGGEGEQRTVNPVYMNGDFTLEFWMKWSDPGTILRNGRDRFVLGVTDDGHFEVNIGTAQFISRDVLPKDEWTYVAVNYKEADMTMSALAQSGTSNLTLFKKAPVDSMAIASISYSDDNYIYLGNMKGAIHDLTVYNICRDLVDAAATKYQTKNGYVYGMTNHWAMDEGHGTVAADTRNTHDFIVNQQWLINNVNYALGMEHVQDGSAVEANIASANTFTEDSYAIELWHMGKASGSGTESVFETNSNEAKRLKLYYDEDKNMVLAYGKKSQTVATTDVAPYGDWHHLALNVVRGQSAVFFVDGKRTAVIAESDMPALTGSRMKLGENSKGNIDELRIWRATLSEKRLLQNMYNTLDTADIYSRGLVAYYPFEKDSVVYGVQTKVFTLKDMAPGNSGNDILANTALQQTELQASVAPPLKNAVVESRLTATPTASDRKVVIRLRNTSGVTASELEGCQLNITLDKVHDMHGNQSEPIRWTAYVRKNTLVWMKDSVTIIKPYGEDYYFDVDIKNLGGNTEYYSLSNMRSWLEVVNLDGTPVETEGTVAPESQKTLRFWVKPLVAVGNYDITVGLQGNQEIMEPLRIVMKVRGEAPDWAVDPTKYENSMNIVGQVYVNGVLMSNSESRLAAFIDNECRGVAEIRPMRGAAYVAMSIYGTAQQNKNGTLVNLDNGQPISFRIWDASKGMVYANVNTAMDGSSVNITFDDSKTYGNFNVPVIFTKSNLIEQELKLKSGWNWLSLGVEPKETKTNMVFKSLTPWNVHIKDRSTGTYYCNGTYWDGTLTDIHANTMYKMEIKDSPKSRNMEMPSLLAVTGESVKAAETKVTLKKGWNWIAYVPTVSMTLDRSLAGANPQEGDQVKSQQGFAFYGPYGWEGNLNAMESGKGYLYYSVDDAKKEFVYPAAPTSTTSRAQAVEASKTTELSVFAPVDPENYPDNMSMVIKLVNGEEAVTDAELGAFIDGECRGAATAMNGLYYLLIAGEGYDKPMELRVAVNGDVMTLCTDVTFSSDAIIGTPWEPYVINLLTDGIRTVGIDADDDDAEWYTLQGIKIGRKPTHPGVYIHRGEKVRVK